MPASKHAASRLALSPASWPYFLIWSPTLAPYLEEAAEAALSAALSICNHLEYLRNPS